MELNNYEKGFSFLDNIDQESLSEEMRFEIQLETLTETAIYQSNRPKLYLAIYPDIGRNFESDPYFKVSWKPINRNTLEVARISMVTGKYVFHYGSTVEIPKKVIPEINKALFSYSNKTKTGYICWYEMLCQVQQLTNADPFALLMKIKPKLLDDLGPIPNNVQIIRWGKDK